MTRNNAFAHRIAISRYLLSTSIAPLAPPKITLADALRAVSCLVPERTPPLSGKGIHRLTQAVVAVLDCGAAFHVTLSVMSNQKN